MITREEAEKLYVKDGLAHLKKHGLSDDEASMNRIFMEACAKATVATIEASSLYSTVFVKS